MQNYAWFLIFVCLNLSALEAQSPELPSFTLNELQVKAETQKAVSLDSTEPQSGKTKTYVGYDMISLLKSAFKSDLSPYDTVVFHCRDGYRADIPRKEFEEQTAILAFQTLDGSKFKTQSKTHTIDLAPFYLVWKNTGPDSGRKKEISRWPYQITGIELVDSQKHYKNLVLTQDLQMHVRGQKLFMKHCFSCHSLNGVGGKRGPPLNPFLEAKSEKDLVEYALSPKKFNPQTKMPGLDHKLENRKKAALEIIRYAKVVSQKLSQ